MRVQNMISSKGNSVPNQFIITDNGTTYFQSYDTIIVKVTKDCIFLDENYWNYSITTSKYRNLFLGETKKETEKKIKKGTYVLTDLN